MNAHSSRSHAICTLSFEVVRPEVDDKPETVTSSKFHMVDLAGSERAKKTGAEVSGEKGTATGLMCGRMSRADVPPLSSRYLSSRMKMVPVRSETQPRSSLRHGAMIQDFAYQQNGC